MSARLLVVLTIVLLAVSACGDDDSTPSPSVTATSSTSTGVVTPTATNGGIVPPTPTNTDDAVTYSTPATNNERVVALLESGFTTADGELAGGVMLHNRNLSEAVVVPYTVDLVLRGGGTLPAIQQKVVLLPNETLGDAFTGQYTVADTEIATVKIAVLLQQAQWLAFADTARLIVDAESSSAGISGTITNGFANDTGLLRLSVLARDVNGRILAGESSSVASISPNGSAEFDESAPEIASDVVSLDAFVSFVDAFPSWMAQ